MSEATPGQRVRLARHSGFCFGVQRAIEMALEAAHSPSRVYALGPLIHNKQVVSQLEELGVTSVERVEDATGGVLLIRTHGVPSSVIEEARALGVQVVDTTCPFVRRVHERARALRDEGYEVVIVGEHDHPEVVGIMGWIGGEGHIVEHPEDVAELPPLRQVGVVAQTTQTLRNLSDCTRELLARCREVRVFNTLCDATMQRQTSAEELSREVGAMVVVGGLHSGNTRRLAEICAATGTPTYHIETAGDIDAGWFRDLPPDADLGVTAGASTPDAAIREVVQALEEMLGADSGPAIGSSTR